MQLRIDILCAKADRCQNQNFPGDKFTVLDVVINKSKDIKKELVYYLLFINCLLL